MNKNSISGFTLIEIMVVVVISAILVAIAWPSYQSFIRQTRLERARADLTANAQMLERFYSQCHTFTPPAGTQAPCEATALNLTTSEAVSRFFTITYAANNPRADAYELIATPVANTGENRTLHYDSTTGITLCEASGNCVTY